MFRVRWERRALNELALLWSQADSAVRQAIAPAAHEVDQRLQNDPHNEGESRSGGRRVLFVGPLVVLFRVEDDGQTVSVLQVRLSRRPRP